MKLSLADRNHFIFSRIKTNLSMY